MSKQRAALPNLHLDPDMPVPLHQQLYQAVRGAILRGQLASGTRLPATRELARELGVARNTVMNAYEQLLAEGYLEGRSGSGTYVNRVLPAEMLQVQSTHSPPLQQGQGRTLSRRGALLSATPASASRDSGKPIAFRPGLPALDTFPFDRWARLMARHWRQPPIDLLSYGSPAGYQPLREALAEHLRAVRGVRCAPDQVIVVSGSQQGLDLAARVLLDPGDAVWLEDPGYMGARGALTSAGAKIVPVPVDAEGLDVRAAIARSPTARLAYVTPSHQFPLGVTMSLPRRLALLDWAHRAGAWVLEDDYDSEYRYTGRPLPALQGLDGDNRTVYLGTLSKTLFPSLRLGYVVVPADLVPAFVAAKALADRHAPTVEQAVLADFIVAGDFDGHIRRTRKLYAERQAALVDAAAKHLTGLLDVRPAEAGMHLVGYLPQGIDDRAIARQAAAGGVEAPPLSAYALAPQPLKGLMLGYAAFSHAEIESGIRRLAAVLRSRSA